MVTQKDQDAGGRGGGGLEYSPDSQCSTWGFSPSKFRERQIGRLDQTLVRAEGLPIVGTLITLVL